jgi:hypothetical protein
MSRYLSFAPVFLLLLIVSCQKETSFEQGIPAQGSLQGNFGDCLAKKIGGIYTATKSLADTNYIDVEVDVTKAGRYTIYTDTVNGYFFRATGNFTTVGSNTVRMKGFGTPASAGTNDFIVVFDSSFCNLSVTVLPSSGASGGTAVYSLQQGTGGSCMNATPAGTFTQGTALTSANKITINVNVTNAGTWNVTTPSVAGFSFTGSGTFTGTGNQTITLTASGTPNASGAQTFPVTVGTSSCSFVISVQPGTTAPNTDHLPLTANSYWTYNDALSTTTTDTIKRVNDGSATHNGANYRVITEYDNSTAPQWEYHFRKTGNDYFEYTTVDDYSVLTFDGNVEGDILFLKEGLTTGATWFSSEYTGTVGGVNKKLRYSFACADANTSITVNGKSYTNVYKITWKSQVSTNGGAYTDEGITWESYYAQGVGLVDMKATLGPTTVEYKLRYYKVF